MKLKTAIKFIALISLMFASETLSADNRKYNDELFPSTPGRRLQETPDFVPEEDVADLQAPTTSPEDLQERQTGARTNPDRNHLQTNVAPHPNTTPHPLSGAVPIVLIGDDPVVLAKTIVFYLRPEPFELCRDSILCAQNEWMDINPVSDADKDAILDGLRNRFIHSELELTNGKSETFLDMPLMPTNPEERETRTALSKLMWFIPRERLSLILRDICNPFDLSKPIDIPRVKEILERETSLCKLELGQSSSDLASQMLDDSTRAKSTRVAKWSVDYEELCTFTLMMTGTFLSVCLLILMIV